MNKFEIKTNINPNKVYVALEYDTDDSSFICGYLHCPNRSKWSKEEYPWIEYNITSTYYLDKEYPNDKHSALVDMEEALLEYRSLIYRGYIWELYEFDSQKKAKEFLETKRMLKELVS